MLPHPRYILIQDTATPTCKKRHPGIGLPPSARHTTSTIFAFLSGFEILFFLLRPNLDDGLTFADALSELK
jgi:hypothetical protein